MTKDELKQWLRENLVIDSKYTYQHSSSNEQTIALFFKGDEEPFTTTEIYVPNEEDFE